MGLNSEPTVLPAIIMSDGAIIEAGTGKKSLIGCFDGMNFASFPAKRGLFFATAWITNIEGDLPSLDMACRVEMKTGHCVFSSAASMPPPPQKFKRDFVMCVSVPIPRIEFPTPGTYTLTLMFSGQVIGTRDFEIRQQARPSPSLPSPPTLPPHEEPQ